MSEDLDCLSGRMEAQVNGASLEEAYLSLYPQGETLAGTVSLPCKRMLRKEENWSFPTGWGT